MSGRQRRVLGTLLTALVMLVVAGVIVGWFQSRDGRRDAPAAADLQVALAPATGVRTGAPTVVTGVIANTGPTSKVVTLTLGPLPSGTSLTSVIPAPSAAGGWSCASLRCTWSGADGSALMLAPNSSSMVLFAFDAPPSAASASVMVTLDGAPPVEVGLSLADGAPALAADAISLSISGGSTLLTGSSATSSVTVSNFSASTIAAGALTVQVAPPSAPGVEFSLSGNGWSCAQSSCTNAVAIASLAPSVPIVITSAASAGAASGVTTLAVSANASVAGASLKASASSNLTVRPARSWVVGTRVWIAPSAVVEGTTAMATIEVAPTGQGSLTDVVEVSLELPSGFSADWSSAVASGPWTCSGSSCVSNGPLTPGVQYLIDVPISVPVGARPGTSSLSVTATVADADGATPQKGSSTSLVVTPAPAASIRASLSGVDGVDPRGGSIGFAPGAQRPLHINVTNEGASPLRAGSSVYVTASPSDAQTMVSAGVDGWSCSPSKGGVLTSKKPLVCKSVLSADLAAGTSISVPFALAPDGVGASDWTIGVGTSRVAASANSTHTRVEVQPHGPRFVPSIVEESPIHDGGDGLLVVRVVNHGDRAASGGVVTVALPSDAAVVAVDAPSWSCLDSSFVGAAGVLTCSTSSIVTAGASSPSLFLSVAVTGHPEDVELSVWASAVGQFDAVGTAPVSATFSVASAVQVDAGPDLTVATPVLGSNGVLAPAVVTLTGTSDLTSAKDLQWTQLCVQSGAPDCGGAVSPAITWLGVPAGASPASITARFTAPSGVTSPVDLFFRLTGVVGTTAISDDMVVHVVPATFASNASGGGGVDPSANSSNGLPQPGPQPSPAPPTASIAGAGPTLQFPTRAAAQLVGGGTGAGSLEFAWTQTDGPDVAVTGASASQAILQFTTPTLSPDQPFDTLAFELTVTDSTGATATATVAVQVIWGDDGLQVVLAGGAANVVASVDGPIVISSTVTSRGAPYTYEWNVDGIALPADTTIDAATLAFVAGAEAANGSASLTVTDGFGRVTTVSVPVIVSALPAGQIPVVFCDAVSALQTGRIASLSGAGVQVTIPSATVSTATCTTSTVVSFSAASASLPGGVTLGGATGQLTIAGVSFDVAAVGVPTNWLLGAVSIGPGGLLAPFVSSTQIGVPIGDVEASSSAVVAPSGWTGSTSISFGASPQSRAIVTSSATGPAAGQALQITATSIDGSVVARLSGTGLVAIGPIDVPISGTFTTSSSTATPAYSVQASLTASSTLGAGVQVTSAALAWTPMQSTGDVTLSIGTGPSAIALASSSTVITGAGTTFNFSSTPTVWSTSPGAPVVSLSGTGSVQGEQLTLALTSAPVGPWVIGPQLSLTAFGVSLSVDCPLSVSSPCGPSISTTATATGSAFAGPVAIAGPLDPSTGLNVLSGASSTITVSPLTISGSTLLVTVGPGAPVSASATGSTSVLGVTVPVAVDFGATSTVAEAEIGTLSIAEGWSVPSAIAIATTAPFTYSTTIASAGDAPVSLVIAPGVLTGVGVTQLPTSIVSGVLPDEAQSGLVSFAIGSTAVTSYSIAVPLVSPWFVAGDGDSDISLAITSLSFAVTTTNGINVRAMGTGLLSASSSVGGAGSDVPMPFTGQLTPGSLSVAFSSSSVPWSSAFGAPGFSASALQVQLLIDASGTTATLTGNMALPATLVSALSTASGALPQFTVDLEAGAVCVAIDLSTGAASGSTTPNDGVDVGGYGFIASSTAYIALSSGDCTVGDVQVGAGISVVLNASTLGNLQFAVDPRTDALSGTFTGLSPNIGGVSFDDATVTVSSPRSDAPSVTVSGGTSIAGQSVTVSSAIVQQPDGANAFVFTSDVDSLTLGWLTMTDPDVSITAPSVVTTTPESTTVAVSGTLPILGGLAVDLTGTIENGEVTMLDGMVASTTYSLFGSDTLTTSLSVAYDQTAAPSLVIGSSTATIPGSLAVVEGQGATRIYALSSMSVQGSGALDVVAATPYLTEGITGQMSAMGIVSGTYAPSTGAYSFANGTSLSATLGGLSAPTNISFTRSGGSTTATQSSALTPGIFDGDVTITASGTIGILPATGSISASGDTNVLTGSATSVGIRGLSGDVTIAVSPATNQKITGFTAFENSVTYAAHSGCAMWEGDPTLQGVVYRSNGTTLFTLAGTTPTVLSLPAWWTSSSSRQQPVVLSNEVVPGAPPATNGITIAYPFSTAVYSGFGQVSFDFATCAFSVGGTAMMSFNTLGSVGQALDQALSGPQGLQIQVGSLFGPSGELPPSVVVARALLQAEGLSAELAQMAAVQTSAANAAQDDVTTYGNLASLAQQDVDLAIAKVQAAQQALDSANSQVAGAYAAAAGELQAANEGVAAAQRSASDAQASLVSAQTELVAAQGAVARVSSLQADAQSDADDATQKAQQYQQDSQEANHPTLFQLTLQITYCSTCQTTFSVSVDGQFNFAAIYVVDLGFTLQISSSGIASEVDIGGGLEKMGQASLGPVGASFTAELVLDLNFGLDYVPPDAAFNVTDFSATLEGNASVDVWANLGLFSINAQLASIEIQASLQFVPWPAEWSAAFEVQIGPFSDDLQYGPASL